MTSSSSTSGWRSISSRRALPTISPIVSSSLRDGRTRLTVRPCLRLRATRRSRSPNSRWWKFDSPNQRSTRSGTERASWAARSAAASVSARCSSLSNVAWPIASRVLTTITVLRERVAIASGRAPNRKVSPLLVAGAAEAPMTTTSAVSASRRMALRTFGASRTACSTWPSACWRMKWARARSDCVRIPSAMPRGTRCRATTRPSLRWARASAKRSASSACGPPRMGTRMRLISAGPRCLTTAMSHGESRTTSSIVGEKTEACGPGPGRRRLAAPAEDDQVRVQLRRGLDDALGGAPSDADDGVDGHALRGVVEHPLQQPAGLAGARGALAQRRSLRHLDDAEHGQDAGPAIHQRGAEADQLLGGQRVRDRDQDPRRKRRAGHRAGFSGARARARVPRPRRPAPAAGPRARRPRPRSRRVAGFASRGRRRLPVLHEIRLAAARTRGPAARPAPRPVRR